MVGDGRGVPLSLGGIRRETRLGVVELNKDPYQNVWR
jgi:hypothetical protein